MTWIPCSERMPSLYETVLACMEVKGVPVVRALILAEHGEGRERLVWEGISAVYPEIERVTHWQPLPDPLK